MSRTGSIIKIARGPVVGTPVPILDILRGIFVEIDFLFSVLVIAAGMPSACRLVECRYAICSKICFTILSMCISPDFDGYRALPVKMKDRPRKTRKRSRNLNTQPLPHPSIGYPNPSNGQECFTGQFVSITGHRK